MRHDTLKYFTYYIIAGPEDDECIKGFKDLLDLACQDSTDNVNRALFQHPLEPHLLLSKISCESSQEYVNVFRQSMFAQVRTARSSGASERLTVALRSFVQLTCSPPRRPPTARVSQT